MLRALRQNYPDRCMVLIWHSVRYHHSKAVRHCAAELGIELIYLPAYSPDFMHVERLWHWLRQELRTLHCHQNPEELQDRIAGFQAQRNEEPNAVHRRLHPKTHLDPEEEKLRI